MFYKIFGWWFRWQACKMAAQTAAGWNNGPDDGIGVRVWSLTVFFETYMLEGAEETRADFGPKDAPQLSLLQKV